MTPKHNAYIDEAYQATLIEGRWINTNRIHTATLPVDAVSLPYPSDASVGSVYSVAYWDEDDKQYHCMERATIRPRHDYDPLNDEGGTDDESVRDYPQQWSDEGGKINFYPPADKAYLIRMGYTLLQNLTSDDTECPIDGEAVKLHAMMLAMMDLGDTDGARGKMAAWQRRMKLLENMQRTGEKAVLTEEIHDCPDIASHPVPNWDRGPY